MLTVDVFAQRLAITDTADRLSVSDTAAEDGVAVVGITADAGN